MKKGRQIQHGIQGVFVFVLLALFALMSILMVLFGAQMYRGSVEETESSSRNRVLYSYVRSMVRAEDARDAVAVEKHDDVTALAMYEEISGSKYVTWLYEHDGKLYEQFTGAESDFEPSRGVEIAEVKSFEPSLEGRLLTVGITAPDGREITIEEAVRTVPADSGRVLQA